MGQHFGREAGARRKFEVVGIAKDARYLEQTLDDPVRPLSFLPEAQADYARIMGSLFLRDVVVLARPGASLSLGRVRQAIASADPTLPVLSIRTLRDQVAR